MRKPDEYHRLAADLSQRSVCNVQVGAVLVDSDGRIFAWGWNNSGPDGLGQCAEQHALSRANKRRVPGSVMYIYGQWRHNSKPVDSVPCDLCLHLLRKYKVSGVFHSTNRMRSSWMEL